MGTFVIHTHGRLQEWVAEEKGYFQAEGLTDYVLKKNDLGSGTSDPANITAEGKKYGAYESYETGARDASVSCACHWTVNMAAATDHGSFWGEAYSVSPGAIMVPPESPIRTPDDLAGVPIHVGYHSGSHYTTVQTLEPYLANDQIKLHFGGLPDERVDSLVDRKAQAGTVFGMQLYVLQQLGFRTIADATFMIIGNIAKDADLGDVRKYYNALRCAQSDIDMMHQKYTHYYKNELPERYHATIDVRRFGPGERIVFEPYSKALYDETQQWIRDREFFDLERVGSNRYEDAVALV